jgi:hypothetical protein
MEAGSDLSCELSLENCIAVCPFRLTQTRSQLKLEWNAASMPKSVRSGLMGRVRLPRTP